MADKEKSSSARAVSAVRNDGVETTRPSLDIFVDQVPEGHLRLEILTDTGTHVHNFPPDAHGEELNVTIGDVEGDDVMFRLFSVTQDEETGKEQLTLVAKG